VFQIEKGRWGDEEINLTGFDSDFCIDIISGVCDRSSYQKYSNNKIEFTPETFYRECPHLSPTLHGLWAHFTSHGIELLRKRFISRGNWQSKKGKGTTVADMESYPRYLGFKVHSFLDHRKDEMKYLLVQGYPLIVLGVPPPEWYRSGRYSGEGHYVVVVGYDDPKKLFIVYDPGPGRKMEIPYDIFKDFHRSHPTHGNYVLCIYPKGK